MWEEDYPGLAMNGLLTATRLCAFAVRIVGKSIRSFNFCGEAPTFADQTIRLIGRSDDEKTYAVRVERPDDVVVMSAQAVFG